MQVCTHPRWEIRKWKREVHGAQIKFQSQKLTNGAWVKRRTILIEEVESNLLRSLREHECATLSLLKAKAYL